MYVIYSIIAEVNLQNVKIADGHVKLDQAWLQFIHQQGRL